MYDSPRSNLRGNHFPDSSGDWLFYFFYTAQGRFGLTRALITVNDNVVFLAGADKPFMLQQSSSQHSSNEFTLFGTCGLAGVLSIPLKSLVQLC